MGDMFSLDCMLGSPLLVHCLCVALAVSIIMVLVLAFIMYKLKTKLCSVCKGKVFSELRHFKNVLY